mgnify:CR=1 FL=1
MRKKLALLLCAFPILLSACSAKSPAQPPLTFRTALLQAGGCTFTAAMQLGLGSLANGNLAPLAAPYVLGQCWAGEYIDSTGTEDGLLRTTYRMGYEEKELVVDTWFSQEPLTPVRAEISFEGRMVLRTDISAFSMRQPTQLTEE